MSLHSHRFTLLTGRQVVSSVAEGNPHIHTVDGRPTSSDNDGKDHTHTLDISGIVSTSGPPVSADMLIARKEVLNKGMFPDLVDPNHTYVFRSGHYGIFDYWYIDLKGNYWRYTNAPEDSEEHDKFSGTPLMVRNQPMPDTAPTFFTPDGRKRHMGVPPGVVPDKNPSYNPLDASNTWYEVFDQNGEVRYVYLDADVRENLDLWVQYELRVTDSNLVKYRKYSSEIFKKQHPKDRIIGCILILMDQGLFELEELINATVGDLEFIDQTVKLLGRKFNADLMIYDFLTSLVGSREKEDPLFQIDTVYGKTAVSKSHVESIFHYLRVSPTYLLAWHASHMYSRIFNRLALEQIPPEEIEQKTLSQLKQVFSTQENIQFLVDYKVRDTLMSNYGGMAKAISRTVMDDFAVLMIYSDLIGRKHDEAEFSTWLHAQPMHLTKPNEAEMVSNLIEENKIPEPTENTQDEQGATDTQQPVGAVDKEENSSV